jgi:CubicO group peptidase (beta-lactamase class C family)
MIKYAGLFLLFFLSSCSPSLEENINAIIQKGPFNGVVMVYQANIPLYVRAHGMKDFENKIPLTIDDQFMIGSISKKISALTVVKSNPDLHEVFAPNNTTLHKLLTHTTTGKYDYSSQGYVELAKIMEKKTGRSFDDLLQETLRSARMHNTTFQPQESQMTYTQLLKVAPRLVKSYSHKKQQVYDTLPRTIPSNAAGGLISTAKDLILWNEALWEKKIWGKDSTALIQTPHIDFNYRWGKVSYGYGTQIVQEKPLEYSHTGMVRGFISTLLYYPATKTHVIILENVYWETPQGGADFARHDAIRKLIRNYLS